MEETKHLNISLNMGTRPKYDWHRGSDKSEQSLNSNNKIPKSVIDSLKKEAEPNFPEEYKPKSIDKYPIDGNG